uniref:hypothetical protein n=1 Tax=Candidatus Electronema sp. TaxID=2698783 RepID=UPI0040570322
MWYLVRFLMIFIFGAGMTQVIEESESGAFIMGALALALTIWMAVDIMRYVNG